MFKKILVGILIFLGLVGVGFATGKIQAIYNRTVGIEVSSSETDMWHKSKGYIDGMVQDLSKHKLELEQTKDTTARTSIINYINDKFANFNEKNIENLSLRQFLIDCRNGNIK